MQSTRYFWLLFVLATWNRPDHVLASESDVDAPFSVAAVLVHKQAFDRPHDVELQGDLAFVPGKGGSLAIVDVTDPTKPQLLWHRHDTKGLDDAESVLPSRDQLFLGTHDFISIDIRNPKQPVFATRLSTMPKISHINGMVRRGDNQRASSVNTLIAVRLRRGYPVSRLVFHRFERRRKSGSMSIRPATL